MVLWTLSSEDLDGVWIKHRLTLLLESAESRFRAKKEKSDPTFDVKDRLLRFTYMAFSSHVHNYIRSYRICAGRECAHVQILLSEKIVKRVKTA